jgi:hypothetical protein
LLISRKEQASEGSEAESRVKRKFVNKLFAGYELKVEKTAGNIDSAIDQASDYRRQHDNVDMFLLNFILDTTEHPTPIRNKGVTLVNIEYPQSKRSPPGWG